MSQNYVVEVPNAPGVPLHLGVMYGISGKSNRKFGALEQATKWNRRCDATQFINKNRDQLGPGARIIEFSLANENNTINKCTFPTKNSVINHFIFVLDRSGSMHYLVSTVAEKFNEILATIRKASDMYGHETYITLYYFASKVEKQYERRNIKINQDIYPYAANGQTSLFDAVGQAIGEAKLSQDFKNPNASFVLNVLTDGEENNSTFFKADSINTLIKDVDKTGRWTVTFQVPYGYKNQLCNVLGLCNDNVLEWEQTKAGVLHASNQTSVGTQSYYAARSSGQTNIKNFYNVTSDLSNVSDAKIQQKLKPVTGDYHFVDIPKESVIKDVVEHKFGNYWQGRAYYQLMKTETVQPNKEVLLRNKKTGSVYGGSDARSLIGLVDGANNVVEPGNHTNYDIFIQSNSVNRKLPRGTKLLVRK